MKERLDRELSPGLSVLRERLEQGLSPGLSVLVPVFNAENTLRQALESVLEQKGIEFKLIACDDGSQDRSLEILEELAQKDGRIEVLRNPENLGISKTRNRLLERAQTDLIAWLDADDIALPGRLKAQAEFLRSHPAVAICGGGIEFFDDRTGKIVETRSYYQEDFELRKRIFRFSPVSQGAAMARLTLIHEAGGFDESLPQAEDLDLSFRLGRLGEFANLGQTIMRCRIHQESISHTRMRENIRATLRVRRRAVKEYGYRMSLGDRLAGLATRLALVFPTGLIRRAFVFLRKRV